MTRQDLFEAQKPVTVEDLEKIGQELKAKREEVKKKKDIYSAAQTELDRLENNATAMLKTAGKKTYISEFGRLTRVEQFRVKLPQSPEDWNKFLEYAKERGVYDELITVNSNELNSFYMQEWDNVKKNGSPEDALSFSIPGIEEPKVRETISFTKSK